MANTTKAIQIYTVMGGGMEKSPVTNTTVKTCMEAWKAVKKAVEDSKSGFSPVMEPTTAMPSAIRAGFLHNLHEAGDVGPIGTVTTLKRAQKMLELHPEVKTWVAPNLNPAVIQLAAANKIEVVPGVVSKKEIAEAAKFSNVKMVKIFPSLYKDDQTFFAMVSLPGAEDIRTLQSRGCTVRASTGNESASDTIAIVNSPSDLNTLASDDNFRDKTVVIQMPDNQPSDIENLRGLVDFAHSKKLLALASGIEGPGELLSNLTNIIRLGKDDPNKGVDGIAVGPSAFLASEINNGDTTAITNRANELGKVLSEARQAA